MPGSAWPFTLSSAVPPKPARLHRRQDGAPCARGDTTCSTSITDITLWVCTSSGGCSGLDSSYSWSGRSGWFPGRETAPVRGRNLQRAGTQASDWWKIGNRRGLSELSSMSRSVSAANCVVRRRRRVGVWCAEFCRAHSRNTCYSLEETAGLIQQPPLILHGAWDHFTRRESSVGTPGPDALP
jgi:hypothetical protein